jgi:molybdopterin molybdotransferase
MLSVEEARARIVGPLRAVAAEVVALPDAWGRVTAAPVVARRDQPPADVSAMDGYALRATDAGARRVVGNAPAGHPFAGAVGPGQAVRLFTGSFVPEGADSVLIQEDATRDGDHVTPTEAPVAGQHIRRRGQDFSQGDVLIPAGMRLNARAVGLAAAANYPWLAVHRRPTVAILATGDEIAMPGEPIPAGGIVSSNAHALAALVRARGGVPVVLPIAADRPEAIAAAVASVQGVDMLVTTGGASVGEHDLVQAGLATEGFELDFWKIAMRPGKPLIFGRLGRTAVLGLPGNPVSALVCAILFLLPALDRLQGLAGEAPEAVPARLGAGLAPNDQRADHLRAKIDGESAGMPVVVPFPRQDSSMLRVLNQAEALILRAPHAPALVKGSVVSIIRLDSLGV